MQLAAGNRPELGNQLASVEKLDEKCFNCRCSRIKNSQVAFFTSKHLKDCLSVETSFTLFVCKIVLSKSSLQCGSDGRTYQNLCLLNCAKMRCPEQTAGLTARAGECDQSDQKQGFNGFLKWAQFIQISAASLGHSFHPPSGGLYKYLHDIYCLP